MAYEINRHVVRLKAHLPFGAAHGQIYEEHVDPRQSKSLATKALVSLCELVKNPIVKMVVLTGDAGHGKTHLCRRLLEEILDLAPEDAHARLMDAGKGAEAVGNVEGRTLRIVKDLSEFKDPQKAARVLTGAITSSESIVVVCANEGKLREVVSFAGSDLEFLRATLEESNSRGACSSRDDVFVLDLNHQSVTATSDSESSLVAQLLRTWAVDRRSWRSCDKCDAMGACPIWANHAALSGTDGDEDAAKLRQERIQLLLRVAEESGTTITIRELLILVAFTITGGLDCREVHKRHAKHADDRGWQWRHLFFQVPFENDLTRDQRDSLPLLAPLSRLDPGKNALRLVDDGLAARDYEDSVTFAPPSFGIVQPTPRTRKQAKDEASNHRELFGFLRRRDYFDSPEDPPPASRLGFKFHEEFRTALLAKRREEKRDIRDKLLKGLEAIQDIRRTSRQTRFAVVDPAFGNVSGNASILSHSISAKTVDIVSVSDHWERLSAGQLARSLDWINRKLVVQFGESPHVVELDALQFEFVLRAGQGLSCRSFFIGDIRRLLARLAKLTQDRLGGDDEEIEVIYGDKTRTITIDTGDNIICSDD